MSSYCLRKLAVEVDRNASENFRFRSISFQKLIPFDHERLIQETSSRRDFALKIIRTPDAQSYLYLFYNTKRSVNFQPERQLNLLKIGFDFEPAVTPTNTAADSNDYSDSFRHRAQAIAQLYELLRSAHSNEKLHPDVPDVLPIADLKVTLRSYQTRAVRWLLHRERTDTSLPHGFVPIRCPEMPDFEFFLQPDSLELSDSSPSDILVPTGGILADEMGLGKTIEMLALFLLNRRNFTNSIVSSSDEALKLRTKKRKLAVKCVCGRETPTNLITCRRCEKAQHKHCTRKYSKLHHDDEDYLCPTCWDKQPLTISGATIIVSPNTIKLQWSSEIASHSENVRVFVYDGVLVTGWISPIELSEYDVILTDYSVLTKEINFSSENDIQIQLRNKRNYIRKLSPLKMIDWWRTVLDEAQMVESGVSKSSQMTKKLVATHRWAVTGTPIQKSIDDIRGLLEFLGVPYYQKAQTWRILSGAFQSGNRQPILDILSKVMWRTCKSTVLDELGIPPQSEKVHYIVMSDVQRLFYRGQHSSCSWAFEEKIRKLSSSKTLSEIDPRTLKIILEPLRKLRQDCTIPMILKKMEQSMVKKCLQPHELVAHLNSTNEAECKNHLRSMVSSMNGMAALHIIRMEHEEAAKLYLSVLQLAKKHNVTISVDTLLQIHALHNLVEVYEKCPHIPQLTASTIETYRNDRDTLEWKYISIYNDNLVKAHKSFFVARNACVKLEEKLPVDKGIYWQEIIDTLMIRGLDNRFLERVNEENSLHRNMILNHDFSMIEGISYFIINWIDKLFVARKSVCEEFQNFSQYILNIKPKNEITKDVEDMIEAFVKKTFACHLNELQNTKAKKKNEPKKVRFCDLCKAKKTLDLYECIIFSKTLDKRSDSIEGTWNPTVQENICKALLRFAKGSEIYDGNVLGAGKFLKLIECMKNEYKEYVKLWIEIEYTVKAYDEINMCKMRLESSNLSDATELSNYEILWAEVDGNMEAMKDQCRVDETEFNKKLSRLNYLRYLESNADPEICPICKHQPDLKYAMLQCGHHMCMICLIGMKSFQKNILTCAICRSSQKYEEVYYVTRKTNESGEIELKGNFSTKVEGIVREVLKLKQIDENVKIIIFSHWPTILGVIAQALITNDLKIAYNKSPENPINSFKNPNSKITCLLLMLSQGSKGLNLTEATHVFLVEPILNPGEEQQAIGRVHRIGQTKPTTVHRFIMKETIEENIFNTISKDVPDKGNANDITINNLRNLFTLNLD